MAAAGFAIRPVNAKLIGHDGACVGMTTIVAIGEDLPEVITNANGDTFLRDCSIGLHAWRQVRPFRSIGD